MHWIEELKAEQEQELKADIVRQVNQYSRRTGTPHRHSWHKLYDAFELETGTRLPHDSKLNWITQEGHIAGLIKTAARVLCTTVILSE